MKVSLSSPIVEFPKDSDQAQFSLSDPVKNAEFAKLHLQGREFVVLNKAMRLVSAGEGLSLALIENAKVLYWINYTISYTYMYRTFTQLAVWQSRHVPRGFARQVLDFFLAKFDIVASSDTHYPNGIRMWETFMLDHLEDYVYVLYPTTLVRIETEQQLDDLHSDIWGTELSHKRTRLLVSKRPIDLPSLDETQV